MERVKYTKSLLREAKIKFLLFSLIGVLVILAISFLAYQYHQKVIRQQLVIQNLHQNLSRQLELIHQVAKMGEALDSGQNRDLGKVTAQISVLVESLNSNSEKFLRLFDDYPNEKFRQNIETSTLKDKMDKYIVTAKELSDNSLTNFHEIKRNIRYLSSDAQRELLDLLSRIHSELSYQIKRSTNELNRVGLLFMGLCLLEVFLVWFLVFKPLYSAIATQSANLVDAVYEAQLASKSKTDFLANISHEIRTPMTAILGYTEFLSKDKNLNREEVANAVNIINKNADHLLGLIDEILDTSKIEAGKVDILSVKFSIKQTFSEIFSLLNVKAKSKSVDLIFDISESIPEFVISDEKRIKQILFNLLGNAIKFTEQGFVKLTAGFDESKSQLLFDIEDTGCGIPKEKMQRVFTLFEQADTSVSRKFGGTGLGLALSRGLARKMNGDIALISSNLGKGSHFRSFITVEKVSSSEEVIVKKEKKISHENITLTSSKILLVDDAKENARLFSIYLMNAGAHVDIANSGDEALGFVDNGGQYDLVLLDLQMPEKDGYQVLRELRAKAFKKPVVALTAHAMEEERRKTQAAGFNGHIVKPIQSEDLIKIVKHHISHNV